MDNKGLLASFDAILGLIVVMVLLGTITSVTNAQFNTPSQEIGFNQDANDLMVLMASSNINSDQESIFSKVTQILESGNNSRESVALAGELVGEFLNATMGEVKYNLTENKQLNGTTIASNDEMDGAKNVDSATRTWGNYSFSLYVWK